MRKLVIGMAMASSVLATPAFARDGQWYVEADGGLTIVEDLKYKLDTTNPLHDAGRGKNDYKTGYDFGGILGYDFGGFRLETEASYRRAKFDNNASFTTAGGTIVDLNNKVTGSTNALSFMVNGLLDFGPDDGLQGFVGGGVGVARVKLKGEPNLTPPVSNSINDTDTGFAWQALAGVRAPISQHWDIGLKYRFFNAQNLDFRDSVGDKVSTKLRSHSVLATLAYNFGGAEEVAPPPPPPPPPPPYIAPPPPPPAPVCNKGPYIVFFDWDSAAITPEASSILDSAVSAYGQCANVPVMMAGYTDRSGSPRYNIGLSNRRADNVKAYFVARGVGAGAITTHGFGEENPRVPTADGVRELQNRRVQITYGPGSGY